MEFVVNNRRKFDDFRKKYPDFNYNSYSWQIDKKVLTLSFSYSFSEKDTFIADMEIDLPNEVSHEIIKQNEDYIFRIGLINALSYWKAYCSPVFNINCGNLNESEISWWQDVWYDGMGEFRYRNQLLENSKNSWVNFIFKNSDNSEKTRHNFLNLSGNLIAFTGGKDSSLTLGIMKENNTKDSEIFCINPINNMEKIRSIFSFDKYPETIIHRKVNEHLLTLNKNGALNGHTPFSAIVAFIGVFVASLRNKKYVIVSNESSADEVTILGTDINHQYSKSLIFENNFKSYCDLVWRNGPQYFSILRPLTEIGIIQMLQKHEEVIPLISSCNLVNRESLWCGKCAKCFFSFLMFSAVWDIKFAEKIIGVDMFEKLENLPILYELIGIAENKPFECVGTKEESLAALAVIFDKNINFSKDEIVLENFYREHKNLLPDKEKFNQIACEFHTHLLPLEFEEIIKKSQVKICHE